MTEMAETHVELNQFPVPRVGPRHSTVVTEDIKPDVIGITETWGNDDILKTLNSVYLGLNYLEQIGTMGIVEKVFLLVCVMIWEQWRLH